MKKDRKQAVQYNLFGEVEEARVPRPGEIIPLDFETNAVRMIIIKGQPWWVAVDVCRVLGIVQAASSLRALDEDEKGVHTVHTLGGPQEFTIINQFGVFQLILTSRKEEAKRFKRWLTHEVLPSISKTGFYSLPRGRVARVQKQLGCDKETAEIRCDQYRTNREDQDRLANEKGCVRDRINWHNAGYRGQFGREAKDLRLLLGIRSRETPLDHMDAFPLAINLASKVVTNRFIRERKDSGQPIAVEDQPAILERNAKEISATALAKLDGQHEYGVVDTDRRGKIIDVVPVHRALH